MIGRLATDETFRRRLAEDGRALFQRLAEQGAAELTAAECRALASTPFRRLGADRQCDRSPSPESELRTD